MGRAGGLSTSDRIVEVDGVRLDSADHEKAVAAIQVSMLIMMLIMIMLVAMMITMMMWLFQWEQQKQPGGAGRDHLHGAEFA